MGNIYQSRFESFGCTFNVSGLHPNRTMLGLSLGVEGLFCENNLSTNIQYDAEISPEYWDQMLDILVSYNF